MEGAGDLADLIAWLDAGEDRPVGAVLERLLAWGSARHEETERGIRAGGPELRRSMMASSAPVVPRDASSELLGADCRGMAAWLRDHASGSDDGTAAAVRFLAMQFDRDDVARAVVARDTACGPVLRGPGALVPRLTPIKALEEMYGKDEVGTDPASLASRADLRFFSLLPSPLPYGLQVRLHGGWDGLDRIRAECALGCGLPYCFLDMDVTSTTADRFFGCAPKDGDRGLLNLRELIALGPHVAMLPELSFDTARAEEAERELRAARVLIGVAGSSHDEHEGRRRNVARIVGRGGMRARQDKIVGMQHRGMLEDIQPELPVLELFLGAEWSAAVLICRDFIDEGIAGVLSVLRPSLVLVPAMSARTSDFESRAAAVTGWQGHVLVANTCAPDSGGAVVLLGRPTRRPLSERLERVERSQIEPPTHWIRPMAGAPRS